jgi:hypothetical protein
MKIKKLIALVVALVLFSINSNAGVATIFFENDVVNDTDKDYTHGTRLQYEFDQAPKFIDSWLPNTENIFSIALSQYIYTPYDITTTDFIADSRPYAGWLYISPILNVINDNVMDTFQIDLGITGEASLAEDTQKEIHKLLDSRDPQGWDNQIEEEFGVNLIYNRKHKFKFSNWFDLIPTYGGSIGNIHTYAGAGSLFRVGYNLPDDFGLSRIEPTTRQDNDFYIYLMFDLYGRYVVHDIFLEDSLFKNNNHIKIEKEDMVGEFTSGIVAGNGDYELGFLYTQRSKEYEEQDDRQEFGSIIFSFRF